jgi:hypothetical protein
MDKDITISSFDGEGLLWAYDRAAWKLGIKNYKPQNRIEGLDSLELHSATDETFVLLAGACALLTAGEDGQAAGGGLAFEAVPMKPFTVYTISKGVWHTTVTRPGAKLILVEAADTSEKNSEVLKLSPAQAEAARATVRASGF